MQATGSPITFGQAVVRNFLRFIDGMPFFTYAFGLASCLATKRFQRSGDLAAGTVVIYDRAPAHADDGRSAANRAGAAAGRSDRG